MDLSVANVLSFYPGVRLPCIREWSTYWEAMGTFYYYGFESGQHVEIQRIGPNSFDSRVVNMLRFYPCVLLHWTRSWSTCWDSMTTFVLFGAREWSQCWVSIYMIFYVGFESGQLVEISPMCIVALQSWVVNMLAFYEYVLSFWIREWSTCWVSINMFFFVGLESGQHVDILPMFSIALDSRVVNMLRF